VEIFNCIKFYNFSFIAGGLIWIVGKFLKGYYLWILTFVIIFLAIVLNVKFFVPQTVIQKTSLDYVDLEKIKWDISKISSEYMPKAFDKPKQKSEIANISSIEGPDIEILSINKKTQFIELEIEASRQKNIIFPLAYFPGWKAELNGKTITLSEDKKGTLLKVPKGKSQIHFYYASTAIELVSNLITLAGIFSLIIGIIYSIKRYGKI